MSTRSSRMQLATADASPAAGAGVNPNDAVYVMPQTMKVLMHLTLPPLGPYSPGFHFAPLVFLLEGMIAVNVYHIEQSLKRAAMGLGTPIPPLYASGIRYQEDPAGREDWRDVYQVLARGVADCDQLVIWRCAELRVAGIHAEPVIKWQHLTREQAQSAGYPASFVPSMGLWLVHCSVRFPDGRIEDVSKNLGMGGSYTGSV